MSYSQKTPFQETRQAFFSPQEMKALLEDNHIKHIKIALSDCERALKNRLSTDDSDDEASLIDSLTAVQDLRASIHLMELIQRKQLGVLTQEMLFKTDQDLADYTQNVAIDKPALKPFNYLLHVKPAYSETGVHHQKLLHNRQKPIRSPIFFELEAYECLPKKISAEDIMYHPEATSPVLLSKDFFVQSLKQLYHDEKYPTQNLDKESIAFQTSLNTLWYHIRQSNIPSVTQKQPLGICLN